ncbi:MAG: glycosyltransferase [Bacteroidota bacterium]|nr:glycosyltransferase [Bacteroidota bacterium]
MQQDFIDDAKVSVIIPFFNRGAWLSEAIESVIHQSYFHWEAILIDDGSEKEASDIAKEYSKKFQGQIIYLDHPGHVNKGVTISRNAGINLSKGSYIAFLDADDYWLPEKLIDQLQLFKQHPEAEMICEASRFWYSWSNSDQLDEIVNIGVHAGLYYPGDLMKSLYPLGKGQPPCPTGIMIKKEAFNRSGGFEESFTGIYQLYEDQAFLSKIYLNEKVYISDIANNFYRKSPASLTQEGNDENLYKKVRLYYLKWLEKYLFKHQINDENIMELIKSAMKNLSY